MKHKVLKGLAMAALTAVAADAFAAKELRVATAAPQNTPWGKWFDGIAAKVTQLSGGELKPVPYYSSQLGDEQTVIRQSVRGRIDMSGQSNTATSLVVPEFALMAAPYLFSSPEQADCVFDNHVGHIYGPMLEKAGLKLLTYVEVGNMIIFARKPIKSPADLANYKIRVAPTKASVGFFDAVGANGVPLNVLDATPTLKTGGVNGASWPTVYGIAIGTHKLAPNVTVTRHSHQIGTLTISMKVWNKLSATEQDWLWKGSQQAGPLRKGIRGAEKGLLGKIAKAGIPVYEPNDAEMAQWRAAGQQAQSKLVTELGGRAPEIWPRILSAVDSCTG